MKYVEKTLDTLDLWDQMKPDALAKQIGFGQDLDVRDLALNWIGCQIGQAQAQAQMQAALMAQAQAQQQAQKMPPRLVGPDGQPLNRAARRLYVRNHR